jgi:hypothetical protein
MEHWKGIPNREEIKEALEPFEEDDEFNELLNSMAKINGKSNI